MIKEITDEYVANTYNRYDVVLVRGNRATLYDENNNEYIDFGSGIGINALGVNNKKWQKALISQIFKIGHTSNLYYTQPQAILAKKLCDLTGYKKVFYANSGAEANECAIKTARKYSIDKYGKNRYEIVSLIDSFHGRTIATLSLTGQDKFHKDFNPFLDGFKYSIKNDFNNFLETISDKTCAVYLELIQGEGGVNVLEKDYVKRVYQYCNQNDILLIIDEVQTGNGRTGKLYAYENFDIKPDIVTTAKGLGNGLPISCVLFNDKTKNVLYPGSHGCTFGGNPIICEGAILLLDTLTPNFLNNVIKKGNYIRSKLLKMNGVIDVSGMGLMIGVTINRNLDEFQKKCIKNGLLVLPAKGKIRLLPCLNISKKEIDKGLKIFEKTIKETGEKINDKVF